MGGPSSPPQPVRDDGPMSNLRKLLTDSADRVADYRESLSERRVAPEADLERLRADLGGALPAEGADAATVLGELASAVEPALMSSAGPGFVGFVVGGSFDAAVGADLLTTSWDQLAFNGASSPAAALVDEIVGAWLTESLGLPADASFGIVTGTQAGNTVGLAAARHRCSSARVGRWSGTDCRGPDRRPDAWSSRTRPDRPMVAGTLPQLPRGGLGPDLHVRPHVRVARRLGGRVAAVGPDRQDELVGDRDLVVVADEAAAGEERLPRVERRR